ncbi:DUF1294 domain-containing protein [Enterococcus sp. BWB1-3]|uniref:DUF1294 domain-containing protein n=1 Tax=unclassified Enterococcus TaxID=2608891 RepID=UPI001924E38D|nr:MULTISPECIES: DUF1294 domain-containing protein [unclassified Enterococcus]MBL1229448.1 DUF1294 domain-containing protein [Enterococcus sp. BWB1-3]MCB5952620.1 DUF1294 domain-containing protein [Enterococcus sp. BWT-B8]MCB5956309.1 DUF1294 domain-containing protein [Enterococcus sp. CWB-B31]
MLLSVNVFLWIYLIIINLYVFFIMYYDKSQAKKGGWRIPEHRILTAGIIGGGPAGLIGQQIFRHKSRKLKFYAAFILGSFVFCGILYLYFSYFS